MALRTWLGSADPVPQADRVETATSCMSRIKARALAPGNSTLLVLGDGGAFPVDPDFRESLPKPGLEAVAQGANPFSIFRHGLPREPAGFAEADYAWDIEGAGPHAALVASSGELGIVEGLGPPRR